MIQKYYYKYITSKLKIYLQLWKCKYQANVQLFVSHLCNPLDLLLKKFNGKVLKENVIKDKKKKNKLKIKFNLKKLKKKKKFQLNQNNKLKLPFLILKNIKEYLILFLKDIDNLYKNIYKNLSLIMQNKNI